MSASVELGEAVGAVAVALPALPELPPTPATAQPEQPTQEESATVEDDLTPIKADVDLDHDHEEYVPELDQGLGDGESEEEEEEYVEEVASSNGSVYGEEAKPRIVAGLRGAAAKANAAAVARKGGRPRKNPEDPKWLVSDDDDAAAPRRRQSQQQPARVKAPPPTFGPNTRIVRRQRFKTTSADPTEDKRKGRPRKNPNDPKWKRIDAAREAAEAAAAAAGVGAGGRRRLKREGTEGEDDDGDDGEGEAEGESEIGSLAEGSPFADVATPVRKGARARKSLLNPDGSTKKRGRPLGSKNKPKGSPNTLEVENGNMSGSDFETERPPAKKPRAPRGSKKAAAAALADDPTQPGYGTPVATKWTRNPNAVRHSSRKAAVTKYDDADVQLAADVEPQAPLAPIEHVAEPSVEATPASVVESVKVHEPVGTAEATLAHAPEPALVPAPAPVEAPITEKPAVSAPAPALVGTAPEPVAAAPVAAEAAVLPAPPEPEAMTPAPAAV